MFNKNFEEGIITRWQGNRASRRCHITRDVTNMKFESSKFKAIRIGWSYVERSAVGRSADCRCWEGTFYYTPYELLIINRYLMKASELLVKE